MKPVNALAISIGSLAVVATWLFFGPLAALQMQVWQAFIAWGAHFHNGGKVSGAIKTGTCMSLGALVGTLSIMLAGHLGPFGSFAAPVAVGIGAAAFVLAAHIPLFTTIPCSAYGFSCVGGLILLKGVAPVDAILPTLASILLGTLFAMVSEFIAGKLSGAGGPEALQPA